jgi:hypothetical protein
MLAAISHNNMHTEVAQWMAKATDNGGVYSSQTVNALRLLMTDIKRYGLRNKIFRLNMFVGENSNSGAVPLIADRGASIDTIFGSPSYSPNGGFSPNFSNFNYIDTGYNPLNNITQSSAHQGVWNFSPFDNTVTSFQGVADPLNNNNRFSMHYPWNTGVLYSDMFNITLSAGRSNTFTFPNGTVFKNIICTVSSGINKIYTNGAAVNLSVTGNGSGTIPNGNYLICAPSNTQNNYRVGYYTLGFGLSSDEVFLYNKAITDFMNRLNRS